MSAKPVELKGYRSNGLRFGQLLGLLGLTGFAISQPLLSIAGENPTTFTYAGVQGSGIVVFGLLVALVPPLVIWTVIVAVGAANRRAGDLAFVAATSILAGISVIQWVKSAGIEHGWLLGLVGLGAAIAFGHLLVNVDAIAAWTRYLSPLPVISVALLLLSPTGQLLQSPTEAAAPDAGETAAPSVVVIMLDEFPLRSMLAADDRIDPVRFPNLAGLAEQSTWYPNYTVVADRTALSIPSLLTGTNPTGKPALWTNHPDSIFTLLAPTHELKVNEVLTQMCGYATCDIDETRSEHNPAGLKKVLTQMADVWRQRVSLGPVDSVDFGQFRNDDALAAAEPQVDFGDHHGTAQEQTVIRPGPVNAIIDAIGPGDEATLHYLHVMLPHQPWLFYPDGQPYRGLDTDAIDMPDPDDPDPWIMAELQQGHLFQAQYADNLIGEVIEKLKETGRYDDSLVVVTADHGITFSSFTDMRGYRESSIADQAYVPLIIKAPNQAASTIDQSNLMGIDLLPTIADRLGLDVDWDVDGYPAGSPEIDQRGDTKVFFDFRALSTKLRGIETYESTDHRPTVSDRLVGPIEEGDSPVAGLVARIGAEKYLDEPVTELDVGGASSGTFPRTAQVDELAKFQQPPDVVIGRMVGTVDDATAGRTVLVAFNGTVVSAAPVREDGAFETVLPPDIQDPDGNEVTLYQVADDGSIVELALT